VVEKGCEDMGERGMSFTEADERDFEGLRERSLGPCGWEVMVKSYVELNGFVL
jgi:hypothetical protein